MNIGAAPRVSHGTGDGDDRDHRPRSRRDHRGRSRRVLRSSSAHHSGLAGPSACVVAKRGTFTTFAAASDCCRITGGHLHDETPSGSLPLRLKLRRCFLRRRILGLRRFPPYRHRPLQQIHHVCSKLCKMLSPRRTLLRRQRQALLRLLHRPHLAADNWFPKSGRPSTNAQATGILKASTIGRPKAGFTVPFRQWPAPLSH